MGLMSFKKFWRFFRKAAILAVCAGLVLFGGATAQENDFRRALGVISDKFHQKFPYLQGEVVAVKGADIFLSVGKTDRAIKGNRLTVFRKGAPFRHPVTGVVLGTLEEEIGLAEIVEVREKFSIARMTKISSGKNRTPRVKDKVRLSSAKIRIAVLPFLNQTKEPLSTEIVTREFSRLLLSKGRFGIYDVDRLQVWLLESGIAVDQLLKGKNAAKLKSQIRRDFVIQNTIRDVRGKKVMTSRLISLKEGRELFSAVAIAGDLPFEQLAPKEQALRRKGDRRPQSAPNQSFIVTQSGISSAGRFARSFVFSDLEVRGIAIADVNKDGKNEVVVIGTHQVIVYQLSGSRIRELARFDEGVGNDFRWLDVGDMNGNGLPEIYVANYRGDSLYSMVLEMQGNKFVKLASNQNIFFRLLRARSSNAKVKLSDKDAFILLGQYAGFDSPLDGPVYRFRWSSRNKLIRSAEYALPQDLEILGFALWDLDGDGTPEVVEIGNDDLLRVYSRRGEVRFTSASRYGAPLHVFETELSGRGVEVDNPVLRISTRLLVVDTDNDGVSELLTVANEYSGSRLVPGLGISTGLIVSLVWDGSGLSEIWRSKKLDGGVSDFAFGDADNDGVNDLIVVSVGSGRFFSGKRTTIFLYRLAG